MNIDSLGTVNSLIFSAPDHGTHGVPRVVIDILDGVEEGFEAHFCIHQAAGAA